MSGCCSIAPRIAGACASIRADRRSPPCRRGARSPARRASACHRIALEALTPNRVAACRHDAPSSIARTTRLRRSTDSALVMHAGLLATARILNQIAAPLGIPCESFSSKHALDSSLHLARLAPLRSAALVCPAGIEALLPPLGLGPALWRAAAADRLLLFVGELLPWSSDDGLTCSPQM
jgi:hypothetical protein